MMSEQNQEFKTNILSGNLEDLPKRLAKCLKVYVCSNKADFQIERTRLWRDTVPYLQQFCVQRGLDFVWGDVHHGSSFDHVHDAHVFNTHLSNIKECFEESIGPFFLCLIGDKVGDTPLPVELKESEFNFIKHGALGAGIDSGLLEEWYKLDTNAIPHAFRLQPLSATASNDKTGLGGNKEQNIYGKLRDVIQEGVKFAKNEGLTNLEEEYLQQKFFSSGLEMEVRTALELCPERCILVERNMELMESPYLNHFEDSQHLDQIDSLKAFLSESISEDNQFEFSVNWTKEGAPSDFEEHSEYIQNFSALVATKIKQVADSCLSKQQTLHLKSDNEYLSHRTLIHLQHCNAFHQTFVKVNDHDIASKILELMVIGSRAEHSTIMLKGNEKFGKTAILSEVCHRARKVFGKDTILIIRYLGLTSTLITPEELLREICLQLNVLLLQSVSLQTYNISKLTNYFHGLMNRISKGKRHLVIAIDNIDLANFSREETSSLDWIISKLPPRVHILFTYSYPVTSVLERLESKVSNQDYKLQIPEWTLQELQTLFKFKIRNHNRSLTSEQETCIENSMKESNTPFFSSLLAEEASKLSAYETPNSISLPKVFTEFVSDKFDDLERVFSKQFVEAFSQYITLARDGLSEMETLDILSCNNQLILSTFPEELPPILRFPYWKWLNFRSTLGSLITFKPMHGKLLMRWSLPDIQNVVRKRYLSHIDTVGRVQSELAELFMETWVESKPLVDRERNIQIHDDGHRYVCPQPLLYNTKLYNLRRISTLWIQLLQSGKVETFKERAFCDFEFLLAMAHSQSSETLLNNFQLTINNLLDQDIFLINNTLQLSKNNLIENPLQLANELIGRLRETASAYPNYLDGLITQCMQWCDSYNKPLLVPLTSWLRPPREQIVSTISDIDGSALIAPVSSSQHLLCSFGMYDVALCHVPSGKITKIFSGHKGVIRCIAVSQNGRTFVSGADDGVMRIWQVNGGLCLGIIREHKRAVTCVVISDEFDWIIGGSDDFSVVVCSASGRKICTLRGHKKPVTSVKLNSSNTVLASASRDHTIVLWSLDDWAKLATISDGIHSPITCMDLSSDNTFLAVGCENGSLSVISFTTGSWIHRLRGHEGIIRCLAISNDCHHVVVGASDGNAYLYNLRSTKLLEVFTGHNSPLSNICVSKDDSFIFSSAEKDVKVWNFYKGRDNRDSREKHSGNVACVEVSTDGKIALSGGEDGILKMWNLEMSCFKDNMLGHSSGITCLTLSGDCALCVTGSRDHIIIVWTISTMSPTLFYKRHESMVKRVHVLNDDLRVLSADVKGEFHLWYIDTGVTLVTYSIPCSDYVISCDSNYLVTTLESNSANVWEISDGSFVVSVSHTEKITCLSRSENDMYLITGSKDGSLKIWELSTGKLTQVLVEHDGPVTCAAIHENTVISSATTGSLIVWDIICGEPTYRLIGHKNAVTVLRLTYDGQFALTGSRDGTIRLWGLKSGGLITVLDMHEPVLYFSMTGDAKRIAVQLEHNVHVPFVCLHNSPSDPDLPSPTAEQIALDAEKDVLPISPRMVAQHRNSVVFPVQFLPRKKRNSSDSSLPQIIRLPPIRAPAKKVTKSRFRVPRLRKSNKPEDSSSRICVIL